MFVKFITNEEMSKVFGTPLENNLASVYGCFEYEDNGRLIYVLDNLTIKGTISVLFHELFHWFSSYIPVCTDRLDEVWDDNFECFWDAASEYYDK